MDIYFTRRTVLLVFWDIAATFASYFLAALLTGLAPELFGTHEIYFLLGAAVVVHLLSFSFFRLYNSLWEYASLDDALRITLAVSLSTLVTAVFLWLVGHWIPLRVYFGSLLLMVFFTGGVRLLFRYMRTKRREFDISQSSQPRPRTLVVGAGETGSLAIQRMVSKDPLMPGSPIVAVDDNPEKRRLRIHGVPVLGSSDDIAQLVERFGIEQIVVAIPSASLDQRRRIYETCTQTSCQLRTLPNVRELRIDEIEDVKLREVDVADLLGREEVVLNTRMVCGYISGKTILVTGGGGSIGSELCRQICTVAPKRIVVFDIYENDAYLLRNELLSQYDDVEVQVEVGSICNEQRLRDVFERYRPSVVFHAAAHKHVPLMEMCPREAIENNVFGTLNTVRLAMEYGVCRFIFISTDKAVNPTSVMGATKRMGEMIIQHYAQESKTVFAAVRFGNVLGSNGSVIPIFKRQIAEGGPVTVTHPDIERFFMTIPEASRLVIQAGGMASGGEIFILDMGDPVKIVDLARSLITLSGLRVDQDIRIEFTGLRPGEKMYEELLMTEENTVPTKLAGIKISTGREVSYAEVDGKLSRLEAVLAGSDEEAIAVLQQAVPTYTYTANISCAK
ncbi:polysaccharide biosynthesis protein [Eggerthellaceae bacterium zg-1084]|uniref:Polysaccharide biosynthesis protein n=1 Tax=Berryella wangjianweii TaxID=2734634 RepID=A0A6M8J0I6_9ACTN|nr:nucleoside-diphosphate sugar epimerase/dehydratase [Berryella wangjianweii]NPD31118.1 polysaccharide biosynthesis protein [Berryella wangjianweii]NPD32573.1 polysaccharide biosynthesis protein [Eggerthellaceae bacterium zg-997]QKF06681.1 polysaccharide biosynthesis protein [Berryella wangjianweii]